MAKETILVVEDEEDILELISYNLKKEGYTVMPAHSGEETMMLVKSKAPDLAILDVMLGGMDGLEICKRLKSMPNAKHIPVILVTARTEDIDVVTGLEIGADDYITKPFSPRILIARVRAQLRKKNNPTENSHQVLRVHNLEIHPGRHEVLLDGKTLDLTFSEFGILQLLARRPGWVYSRYQIVEAVRGDDYSVTDRSVDVQIVGLRRKMNEAGKLIQTVRGVGYRLKE